MAEKAHVTRISAKDTTPAKAAATDTAKSPKPKRTSSKKPSVLRRIGGYFKGAWEELKQVRWPTRKATWSLTAAVLIFSGFFVGFILLLDLLFKYLFELIIA
ncbi:preprotein translocase subunit SecE [Candidatus Saccharibacteria bacterium]|nr:preprotein translocase subunit SecE [Candidatus Saccharibacteria bacterium]